MRVRRRSINRDDSGGDSGILQANAAAAADDDGGSLGLCVAPARPVPSIPVPAPARPAPSVSSSPDTVTSGHTRLPLAISGAYLLQRISYL